MIKWKYFIFLLVFVLSPFWRSSQALAVLKGALHTRSGEVSGRMADLEGLVAQFKNRNQISKQRILRLSTSIVSQTTATREEVARVLKNLRSAGIELDSIFYTSLIEFYGGQHSLIEVEKYLLRLVKVASSPADRLNGYTAAIKAYGLSGNLMGSFSTFEKMLGQGIEPDIRCFENLLKGFADAGDVEKCERIFDLIALKRLSPSKKAWSFLLNSYANRPNWAELDPAQEALAIQRVFDQMAKEYRPDQVSYGILAKAYNRLGKYREAHALFEEMKKRKVELNLHNYHQFFSALGGLRDHEGASSLFSALLSKYKRPGLSTYNFYFNALAPSGKWKTILKRIKKFPDSGLRPNIVTMTHLFEAYAMDLRWDLACEEFKKQVGVYFEESVLSSSVLDLHSDAFLSAPVYAEELKYGRETPGHPAGVPLVIAKTSLIVRERMVQTVEFPKEIIVGKKGLDILSEGIPEALDELGYTYVKNPEQGKIVEIVRKSKER